MERINKPQRGEIWGVRLSNRERRGSEFIGIRPCLIVSADDYNEERSRVTVIPFTSYTDFREDARSLWGVTVQHLDDDFADAEIDISQKNTRLIEKVWEKWNERKRKKVK